MKICVELDNGMVIEDKDKIADIKDGFWDGFINISERKRNKLREQMNDELSVAHKYQDYFEKRENEVRFI